jgi:hemoglobin-like flavoprotein
MSAEPAAPVPLDARQARLLRDQYARLSVDSAAFAAGFYARLFTLAPLTRALFRQHMDAQGDRFMRMLGRLIAEADRPDVQARTIAELAELHRPHGLVVEDADPVFRALSGEIAARLGTDFDAASEAAWHGLYALAVAPMFAGGGDDPAGDIAPV